MGKQTVLLVLLVVFETSKSFGQGWTDPAINHSRLLKQRLGQGHYNIIGVYKVIGIPFLFSGMHKADIYTPKENAFSIDIKYNTYNQEIDFYTTANNTPLKKEPGEVDSFIIKKDTISDISQDLKFIYGSILGSTEKDYFQLVVPGSTYSLFKRYKSELGYVSENYVQSELRQFELKTDYFYYDAVKKLLKKLKFNLSNIIKEFRGIKDVAPVASQDEFATNPEEVMRKIVDYLNSAS